MLNMNVQKNLRLCELETSELSIENPLFNEICNATEKYSEAVVSLKQKLKNETMEILRNHINPDSEVNVVPKIEFEDWAHCFNVIFTKNLNQKLNSSIFKLNGTTQTDFTASSVDTLSRSDKRAFEKFKNGLKADAEAEVMEIRKVLNLAISDFLGVTNESGGLTCEESFNGEHFNEFRCYIAKAVHVSDGDLSNVSKLLDATQAMVPLLSTKNPRYNKTYVSNKRDEMLRGKSGVEANRREKGQNKTESNQGARKTVSAGASRSSTGQRKRKRADIQDSSEGDLVPKRNDDGVDDEIATYFAQKDYFHRSRHSKKPQGDSKRDCMSLLKRVMYDLKDCVRKNDDNGRITEHNVMVYLYFLFNDAADEIFEAVYDDTQEDPFVNFASLHNNSEKPWENDFLRRSANATYRDNLRLRDVIENIKFMLLKDMIINERTFFTSGSGEEFSITLLLALVKCMRQQDHFDYDPAMYAPNENYTGVDECYHGSYLNFNGASMFINFSWFEWQTLDLDEWDSDAGKNEHRKLAMAPMSILIINGNLKHAGSANISGKVIKKFFMYLDPCPGCRQKYIANAKNNPKDSNDNYIFFDQFYRR